MKLFWPIGKEWKIVLSELDELAPKTSFDETVLAFMQVLSKRFVRMSQTPEIVALGFWLRKSNIHKLQKSFEQTGRLVKARGTVFHIAPSNVDTIFVYSWMLSLLAGNRNVIRVSSKEQAEMSLLLETIVEELQNPLFESIAQRTMICTYRHEEVATAVISEACHTRVIWGGDQTIQAIRQVPLAPLANELAFPDRFSLAVLSSEAVVALTEVELDVLTERFYNDVFWFDQMACSSPRLIIWTGKSQEQAKAHFWTAFEKKINDKRYELIAATQVLKYTTALWMAASDEVTKVSPSTYISRVQLEDIPTIARERHCGGGLFYEYDTVDVVGAAALLVDKDQTVTYFGLDQQELRHFVDSVHTRGVDRIVPIGQALDFSGVWDGQNFLTSFTREVVMI
ncbi:acyl-CoA reductase superfamily protein [Sporosarcina newyorkensis 2681]|uniref:Acyl-CoA reductase superfamily protein n=1 Tax=Sporosarcina newyorkensis 2681 TaxID=1027292 RepID=F9DQ60_9BACL|nr:acyl-CoA reductase [Sporosarcina newyorkensis]EGQ27057.1 acyl-CoA reductase superfamily protein [Sporosarcina newyorkensis 2681]